MTPEGRRGRPQAPGVSTRRWRDGHWDDAEDRLAAEEPLHDVELALGLLWSEGVITAPDQVLRVRVSAEAGEPENGSIEGGSTGAGPAGARLVDADLVESNQVDVHVAPGAGRRPERTFLSSSACGVCGATTIEDLARGFAALPPGPQVDPTVLVDLARRLRAHQSIFESTGGLHAAGLFTTTGESVTVREDVGRHNAVDKVVGRALLDGRLPCSDKVLVVSGRGGYEIVQKAVAAGIPLVAAVGAPSSLAVATARTFNLTLAGFLRDGRFNVYSSPERLTP